jgi:hypothetical protein
MELQEHLHWRGATAGRLGQVDDDKYEKPSRKERFSNWQRLVAALLIAVAIVILAGDGILLQYIRSPQSRTVGKARNIRAVHHDVLTEPTVDAAGLRDDALDPWAAEPADTVPTTGGDLAAAARAQGIAQPDPQEHGQEQERRPDADVEYMGEVGGGDVQVDKQADDGGAAAPTPAANRGGAARLQHDVALKSETAAVAAAPAVDWTHAAGGSGCDAYFGNGFGEEHVVVSGSSGPDGAPQPPAVACYRNPLTDASYCRLSDLLMDPGRIAMSRGGEALDAVMGRREEDETPRFEDGAFEVLVGLPQGHALSRSVPVVATAAEAARARVGEPVPGRNGFSGSALSRFLSASHSYTAGMLSHMGVVDFAADASTAGAPARAARGVVRVVDDPVIFVTRMEYANLFHTSTGASVGLERRRGQGAGGPRRTGAGKRALSGRAFPAQLLSAAPCTQHSSCCESPASFHFPPIHGCRLVQRVADSQAGGPWPLR